MPIYISDNQFPKVDYEEGAAPATPPTGVVRTYAKTDGLLYQKNDAGVETTVGGKLYPDVIQTAFSEANSTNMTITLGSTPTEGNRLVLGAWTVNRDITGVSSTNTTWTKIRETNYSTAYYADIWVGIVGASAGTVITVSSGSSNFIGGSVGEVTDQLTPTQITGQSAASAASRPSTSLVSTAGGSVGDFFVACIYQSNGVNPCLAVCTVPVRYIQVDRFPMMVGYKPHTGYVAAWGVEWTGSGNHASLLSFIE